MISQVMCLWVVQSMVVINVYYFCKGACKGCYPSILYIKPCMPLIHGYVYSLFWQQCHLHHTPALGVPHSRVKDSIYHHYGIFDFALHYPIKLYGFLQAFIVARCPEMFGQPIDSIRAAVSLLVRIQWGTVRFYQPIYASILRINEVIYEIPLRLSANLR